MHQKADFHVYAKLSCAWQGRVGNTCNLYLWVSLGLDLVYFHSTYTVLVTGQL